MDAVRFTQRVSVGEIVEFKGHATYVDQKSGKVRIRIQCQAIDPAAGGPKSSDGSQRNFFNLTYQVKDLKLKQVLPQTYKQSLLYLQGMRMLQK